LAVWGKTEGKDGKGRRNQQILRLGFLFHLSKLGIPGKGRRNQQGFRMNLHGNFLFNLNKLG
jgi:hypothetical protein